MSYSILEALDGLSNIEKISGKDSLLRHDTRKEIISNLSESQKKKFQENYSSNQGVRESILLSHAILCSLVDDKKYGGNQTFPAIVKLYKATSKKMKGESIEAKNILFECINDFELDITEKDIASTKNLNGQKTFETMISAIARDLKRKYQDSSDVKGIDFI